MLFHTINIPSMADGDEHSAPLKVKYHRLQQLGQLATRKSPFQKTRNAVLSDVFLKIHSYGEIERTSSVYCFAIKNVQKEENLSI